MTSAAKEAPVSPSRDRRRVVLLGATGSIGRQACDILDRFPDRFQLVGAVAGSDVVGLTEVVRRFNVPSSALVNPPPGSTLPPGCGSGVDAACLVAALPADIVCVGITGAAALHPTLAAIGAGTDIAIATKEVLVLAGDLVRTRAASSGSRLLPVDSEHSALWQCLRGEDPGSVSRLVLTASGGPFRDWDLAAMTRATPAQALRHPTWTMGPKVTIDSATMMNKGLEVIEAHFLFDVPYSRIGVVVHPTSVVHSYVEFQDGATIAQLGMPDMRVPIALALADGERLPGICAPATLVAETLAFHEVDPARFPAVELARQAGISGGVAPCVLNAANEVAVEAFLADRIRFGELVETVAATVEAAATVVAPTLEDLLEADLWARRHAAVNARAAGGLRS